MHLQPSMYNYNYDHKYKEQHYVQLQPEVQYNHSCNHKSVIQVQPKGQAEALQAQVLEAEV